MEQHHRRLPGFTSRTLWLASTLIGLLASTILLTYRPQPAMAKGSYLAAARAQYPTIIGTALDSCTLCHTNVPSLNQYGDDYRQQGRNFVAIELFDSDGDGFNNITEINAHTFPGDANSQPASTATQTPTPTATISPTSPPGGGCTPVELIQDGGFEAGLPNPAWQTSSNVFSDILDDLPDPAPHSGTWKAWMGGDNLIQESLWQVINVPTDNAGLEVSYWWRVDTFETNHPFDTLEVQIRSADGTPLETVETLTDGDAGLSWRESVITLASYAGQSIQLAFVARTDDTSPTSFFLDDVSVLGSCAATPTPTPTATVTSTSQPTATATPTATSQPAATATRTATSQPTATATNQPTATATPTATVTGQPTFTVTPAATAPAVTSIWYLPIIQR